MLRDVSCRQKAPPPARPAQIDQYSYFYSPPVLPHGAQACAASLAPRLIHTSPNLSSPIETATQGVDYKHESKTHSGVDSRKFHCLSGLERYHCGSRERWAALRMMCTARLELGLKELCARIV